jgi:hypothetical protein
MAREPVEETEKFLVTVNTMCAAASDPRGLRPGGHIPSAAVIAEKQMR